MEAGAGIEPAIEVLQTSALPLGDPAAELQSINPRRPEDGSSTVLPSAGLHLRIRALGTVWTVAFGLLPKAV